MSKGDRFLKWFLGGRGVVDERFKQEVGHVAMQTLVVWFSLQFVFLIAFGFYLTVGTVSDYQTLAEILWLSEFLGTCVIFLAMQFVLIHRGILVQEMPADKAHKAARQLGIQWVVRALFSGVLYWLLLAWFNMGKAGFFVALFDRHTSPMRCYGWCYSVPRCTPFSGAIAWG